MSDFTPIRYAWNGSVMTPHASWLRMARRQFENGHDYDLQVYEARTAASHRHYFAAVNEAFKNLPENVSARFPSPEHLRKWALVQTGYHEERHIACDSERQARAVGALCRSLDEYAVISIGGNVVQVWTAKSQRVSKMDRKTFEESKKAVLDLIASMIGTTAEALYENAGRNA